MNAPHGLRLTRMEIWPGEPFPMGATFDGSGCNFSLFSEVAERVELCLFDEDGTELGIGGFLAIRDETPEAYEALRRLTDVPFAIGEEFSSKWQFLPYIERGIHQFNRLDICNVGGFTEVEYAQEIDFVKDQVSSLSGQEPHWQEYLQAWR